MNTEFEATILEVNVANLEKKLKELGAVKRGDYFQRRYVYDVKPACKNKWIRLRTNGEKSTLTIKEIHSQKTVGGTKELEIVVSDFDKTKELLQQLGYDHRRYEENKRTTYNLEDIEIDIDTWPMIPTYVEIEGPNEKRVREFIEELGYRETEIRTFGGVAPIYNDVYNIDFNKYQTLKFEEQ